MVSARKFHGGVFLTGQVIKSFSCRLNLSNSEIIDFSAEAQEAI